MNSDTQEYCISIEESQQVKIVAKDKDFIPRYATEGSAGADLCACIEESVFILPGQVALIPCGIFCEIPVGFEIQLRPRSGLALKHGITLLNTPATIDSDYRGEIKVILINHSSQVFEVTKKMRIAQMVLSRYTQAHFIETCELSTTERQHQGFGHSGT